MGDQLLMWGIVALFYAPLHYLLPILTVAMGARTPGERRRRIVATAIDCSLSMTLAFALVFALAPRDLSLAMGALLVGMALPYVRIWWRRGTGR